MKLLQLRYFAAVCQYHGVTRAAEALHVSQPTVSSSIQELEREFGTGLFHRTKKSLTLTHEGEFFLGRAEELLAMADQLQKQMCDLGSTKNKISIGIPPMIGTVLFPAMLQRFQSLCPQVRMDLHEQGSRGTLELVMDEALDLALVITDEADPARLHIQPILTSEVLFCTKRDNPLSRAERISLDMLRREPLVMFREDYYIHRALLRRFADAGVEPRITLYSNQLYTIKNFISRGIASAFLFEEIARDDPELAGVPLAEALPIHIGLVWKRGKRLYSDAAKFIEFTRQFSLTG